MWQQAPLCKVYLLPAHQLLHCGRGWQAWHKQMLTHQAVAYECRCYGNKSNRNLHSV